jgi:hypothetical protein
VANHHWNTLMPDELDRQGGPDRPGVYQIRVSGHLDRQWTDWFEGLTITLEEGGDTLLTGLVRDQAALHGLLRKVRDLGLPLVSVNRIQANDRHPHGADREEE